MPRNSSGKRICCAPRCATGSPALGGDCVAHESARPGKATYSLRPECIRSSAKQLRILHAPDVSIARFRGRIRNQTFGGAMDLIEIDCGDSQMLRARIPNPGSSRGEREFEFDANDADACAKESDGLAMYSRAYKAAVTIPPLLWVIVFLLDPLRDSLLLQLLVGFSHASDRAQLEFPELRATRRTIPFICRCCFVRCASPLRVTLCALLLGYPLAYYLSFHAAKRKDLLYQLVIIPLWASYLVRGYAWKTILGSDGVLNGLLQYLHITNKPVEFLLYSPFAVIITLTHIYTPFTFLPIYASLEHIPRNLVEASHDLGASPWSTFRRVILPLSLPGVLAGATFAFVLTFGDFLAPLLVGGPSGIMISNIVVSVFGAAYNGRWAPQFHSA